MAGTMTLYGMHPSPYVQRVLAVLYECGVEDFESVQINTLKGESRTPEFLELNPFGKIPVLKEVDGLVIYESRAIARYLLEKFPEKGGELLGRDIRERADINKWVEIEATNYNVTVPVIVSEAYLKKLMKKEPDAPRLEEHVQKSKDLLDIYDKHLEKSGGYLACERFTFADITHIPYTALLDAAGYGDLISSRPHVAKWWTDITSRPSWVKVWDGPTVPKWVASQASS